MFTCPVTTGPNCCTGAARCGGIRKAEDNVSTPNTLSSEPTMGDHLAEGRRDLSSSVGRSSALLPKMIRTHSDQIQDLIKINYVTFCPDAAISKAAMETRVCAISLGMDDRPNAGESGET